VFRDLKDKTLSLTFKQIINSKIEEFGELLNLTLNSKEKTLFLEIMLLGEKEPLYVHIGRYEILKEGENFFLLLNSIHTSREWIDKVAKKFIEDRKFEIPPNIAKGLRIII